MANKSREEWLEDIMVVSKQNMSDKDDFTDEQYDKYKRMIKRRSIYLSPESIALDAYIIGGICFRISDKCKDNVAYKLVTRAKSKYSSLKKQERFDEAHSIGLRDNSKINDLIASKLVLQETGHKIDDLENFSDRVKAEYDARRKNTYLLASIMNFYEEQEQIGEFYSENDRESKKEKQIMDLESCRKTFEYIQRKICKHNEKIGKVEVWRPNLEEDINQAIKELRQEKIDDKVDEKYTIIRRFLIAEQTIPQDVKDYQEEYFKYLIALLYNLKKAEYKECENSYNKIEDSLKTALLTFSDLIQNGFNNNVTIDYLKELARLSEELSEHLNDKLESQMIEELMSDSMYFEFIDPNLSVYLKENSNHIVNIEKHIKANGYVSLHCDIIETIEDVVNLNIELQGMTGYRDDVATFGTASYGEKRLGANKFDKQAALEKKRPIHYMPRYEQGKTYTDANGNLKKVIIIEGFGRLHEMTDEQIGKWRKNVESITPRYFTAQYNKETDSVEFTFHSILESSKIYYTEINNRVDRKAIREGFEIIEAENLLDKNQKKINLTRQEYKDFIINGGLKKLVGKIVEKYENSDIKNINQVDSNPENNQEEKEGTELDEY